MGAELPWLAATFTVTLINALAIAFVAKREKSRALLAWAWGFGAWGAAILPIVVLESPEPSALAALFCGLLWVMSALAFLAGTYEFAERRFPRTWYVIAGGCVLLAAVLNIVPGGKVGMLPLVVFQSTGLLATGVLIVRSGRRYAGAWLGGGALVGLSLHVLDAPLVTKNAALLPWGFVLADALLVMTALGMLMLYYERARAELLDAERVLDAMRRSEALGRVASGVAHDFNNLLMVIQGNLELARVAGPGSEPASEALATAEQATQQAGRITKQLLGFGRRASGELGALDLGETVRSTVDLLRKVIPADVDVWFQAGDAKLEAHVERALVEQIVLNLVTNARDAIAGSGRIEVELRRAELAEASAVLRVADDGAGMDEAVLKRAFEPFFTTKADGQGTGLGLASVRAAVDELGGSIEVRSQAGRGTTFEVTLPLTPRQPVNRTRAGVEGAAAQR